MFFKEQATVLNTMAKTKNMQYLKWTKNSKHLARFFLRLASMLQEESMPNKHNLEKLLLIFQKTA